MFKHIHRCFQHPLMIMTLPALFGVSTLLLLGGGAMLTGGVGAAPGGPSLGLIEPIVDHDQQPAAVAVFGGPGFALTGSGPTSIFGSKFNRLLASPHLSLTIVAEPSPPLAYHGQVAYTVLLSNKGGDDADGTDLIVGLPVSTTLVRLVEDLPGAGATYIPGPPEFFQWTGVVPANQTVTLRFMVEHTGFYNQLLTSTAEFYNSATGPGLRANEIAVESPLLTIDDVVAAESVGTMVFEVNLPAPSSRPAAVDYTTVNGSAKAGIEYTSKSGTVTVPVRSLTGTIEIDVADDDQVEENKTFFVNLSKPVRAKLADGQAIGLILDDESSQITIGDATVIEGDAGVVEAVFPLSLFPPHDQRVTVAYQTAGDTATAGADYIPAGGVVAFDPLKTSQAVTVAVQGDVIVEANETFFLNLSQAARANIAAGQGRGMIQDDDVMWLSFSPPRLTLSEGNAVAYQVYPNLEPSREMTLTLTSSEQVRVVPAQLTFSPQSWDQPQTATVVALDDGVIEGAHTGTIIHTVEEADLEPIALVVDLIDPTPWGAGSVYLPLVFK